MVRKGLAVRYNVPMRYAGKPRVARAYLAGRRSGLVDLAKRAFMDHALVRICDFAAQHVPADLLPAVPAILGQVPGAPEFLAAVAEDDAQLAESTGALGGICRVCGCTDDAACEGGCSWADDARTLCTKCKASGLTPDGIGSPAPIRVVVVNRERILIRWLLATEYAYHQALKLGMEREDLVRLADGFAAPALTMVERLKLIDQVDAVAAKRKGGA